MGLPLTEQLFNFGKILPWGITVHHRSGQVIQQQVAFRGRRVLTAQQQVNPQAQLGTGKSGSAAMITLQSATGDQGVIALVNGMSGDEFQFAHLVTTEGAARQVIAFDPQSMAAPPFIRGALHKLQGGWRLGQVQPMWVV